MGEDNRQNRETVIGIRKNRNPDWDISRSSFFFSYPTSPLFMPGYIIGCQISSFLVVVLKTVLAFLLVLIPTIFMVATLPVMCKYFATEEANLGQQVGYLYSINTFGAAAGCLFAGYFLIGFFGVLETALVAAGINLLIGLVCIVVFKKSEPGVHLRVWTAKTGLLFLFNWIKKTAFGWP